jgi:hypothetical protein
MDVLLVLSLPVGLAISALRWGSDSRERPPSKERELAGYGVAWEYSEALERFKERGK